MMNVGFPRHWRAVRRRNFLAGSPDRNVRECRDDVRVEKLELTHGQNVTFELVQTDDTVNTADRSVYLSDVNGDRGGFPPFIRVLLVRPNQIPNPFRADKDLVRVEVNAPYRRSETTRPLQHKIPFLYLTCPRALRPDDNLIVFLERAQVCFVPL